MDIAGRISLEGAFSCNFCRWWNGRRSILREWIWWVEKHATLCAWGVNPTKTWITKLICSRRSMVERWLLVPVVGVLPNIKYIFFTCFIRHHLLYENTSIFSTKSTWRHHRYLPVLNEHSDWWITYRFTCGATIFLRSKHTFDPTHIEVVCTNIPEQHKRSNQLQIKIISDCDHKNVWWRRWSRQLLCLYC